MRILVLVAANPAKNPRPSRFIDFLKKTHNVTAMGIKSTAITGVEVISYSAYKKRNFFQELWLWVLALFKKWDKLIFTKNRREILTFLKKREFDLIICHDLVLLPIVLQEKKGAKVLFDAREFYPKQKTTNLRWRILFERFNDELCRKYIPLADKAITVSAGLKKLYQEYYGINCEVFYSLCHYYDLSPSVIEKEIKMIYHGSANSIREIEKTVAIIDTLPDGYCLDLMVIFEDRNYKKKIEKMVHLRQKKGKKIRIIPPVAFEEIIPFSNQYDIGIYAIPASTQNLRYAMPNKFFEYIQARMALAIFPHHEMEAFIQKYQNGIVSQEQTSKSLAQAILSLDRQKIMQMKIKSHIAAKILNATQNETKIQNFLRDLFLVRESTK